jgi:hypothetical protein
MICCIDVYALLSSSGTGAFTKDLLKNNMFPTPERSLTPLSLDQHPVFYPEEESFFPGILKLNHEVLLVALKVGQLARDLREETSQRMFKIGESLTSDPAYLINRWTRINNLRRFMQSSQNKWRSDLPGYGTWFDGSEPLPRRVFSWAMHVCTLFKLTGCTNTCQSYVLFRGCRIFSYTSMFSGQLREEVPEATMEIAICATEILQAANQVISQDRYELRFIVFPLLMAGVATSVQAEKTSPSV